MFDLEKILDDVRNKYYCSKLLERPTIGHSDFATTANIYSHLDASSKVSSLDTLSNIVSIE